MASSEQQDAALAHIRRINTTVEVVPCQHSRVDLSRLLGRRQYSGPEAASLLLQLQLPNGEAYETTRRFACHSLCGNYCALVIDDQAANGTPARPQPPEAVR